MKILLEKLKESALSILPVSVIVFILSLTPLSGEVSADAIIGFGIAALIMIIGMALFNLGADTAMTAMGEHIGSGLTKSRKIPLLLLIVFVMGLLITVAEPDLSILAEQLSETLNPIILIVTVGIGVGFFLLIGTLKILLKKDLPEILMFFYLAVFALCGIMAVNGKYFFIPFSFDSGGVTTGPVTVPFIMALGAGIAATVGGRNSGENSFGLVSLCSIGPVIALMLLVIISPSSGFSGSYVHSADGFSFDFSPAHIGGELLSTLLGVLAALGLITLFFLILQLVVLRLPKMKLVQLFIGLAYTLVGLVLFLTAVRVSYLPMGYALGKALAGNRVLTVSIAFVIGAATVLAEPAVHVLNNQVEEITNGLISKKSLLIALACGVGISAGLSVIRIFFDFSLLYYLIPGYILSLGLSFFVPKIYTAIAFDSGGVASGPMTTGFMLPFVMGICYAVAGESEMLSLAFGMVAMVALTPLITIQILGFRGIAAKKVRRSIGMYRIQNSQDEQIINFM